jgi:hypothetical protein
LRVSAFVPAKARLGTIIERQSQPRQLLPVLELRDERIHENLKELEMNELIEKQSVLESLSSKLPLQISNFIQN